MPADLTFTGPAIVEQDDTTTLVEPGWRGIVLDNGNLLLTRG
jgi:N-methylhydantoinase A